jgi:predicted nuclease of predicted toxin-antitoxin system
VLKFAADENLNSNIIRGLLRRNSQLDILRIQDVALSGASDPEVLAWAARDNRVLITHDVNTITRYAYDRLRAGQPMSGVVAVGHQVSVGQAIEDLLLMAEYSEEGEWVGQIIYLPLV